MRAFASTPFFELKDHYLIAWVGDMNVAELDAYLDAPGGVGWNEPHSLFAADLGRFFDHDFVYSQASDSQKTIRELAVENVIDDELLIKELEEHVGSGASIKCFVILWNARKQAGAPNQFADGKLRCVGSWTHTAPLTH